MTSVFSRHESNRARLARSRKTSCWPPTTPTNSLRTGNSSSGRVGQNTPARGQTLNSDIYCQQLDRLKIVIDQKWPELANRRSVVFHQDNAKLQTSVLTRQNFWELV
ncbi:hypothetical protein TNCV_1006511 [Trichonephila clavipes]|nr:hypothetical protein TNCV_1006511 [Trichonephila clavipes]